MEGDGILEKHEAAPSFCDIHPTLAGTGELALGWVRYSANI